MRRRGARLFFWNDPKRLEFLWDDAESWAVAAGESFDRVWMSDLKITDQLRLMERLKTRAHSRRSHGAGLYLCRDVEMAGF